MLEQSKTFWFRTAWKKRSKYRIMNEKNPVGMPPALQEAGIEPLDPVAMIKAAKEKQVKNYRHYMLLWPTRQ